MTTVRIYGTARNLRETPPALAGQEVWLGTRPKAYNQRYPPALSEWTRYFNLHSRQHMDLTYPSDVIWHKSQDGSKLFYHQRFQPDLPGSTVFPRASIEAMFPEAISKTGKFYSTCTICWLIPFAIHEGFTHIELWGFALSDKKPNDAYKFERPCFFYWVQNARRRGIKITYQAAIEGLPFEPGKPATFDGPVYGYETKPETDLD